MLSFSTSHIFINFQFIFFANIANRFLDYVIINQLNPFHCIAKRIYPKIKDNAVPRYNRSSLSKLMINHTTTTIHNTNSSNPQNTINPSHTDHLKSEYVSYWRCPSPLHHCLNVVILVDLYNFYASNVM